jgi:Flp pilus assembly protein TadB
MQALYIALLASIAAILIVVAALYWRVRRLANASRTQFMRAVAEKEAESQNQLKS